jgi:cytidylate kinase
MHENPQIAIDGPAGAGKSTVGEGVARRLGYLYVDTGAMYRALTWLALQRNVDLADEALLAQMARAASIDIVPPHVDDGRQYTVLVNGQDVTWDIRSPAVDQHVSQVSAHPDVRRVLVAKQQDLADARRVVMVGRDIGTVVLPHADLKIFLTASAEERARRRQRDLAARSVEPLPAFAELLANIQRRDFIDRRQMRPADDAVLVATDDLTAEQVIERILAEWYERVGNL